MTLSYINEQVELIASSTGDAEIAHALEDKLRHDFIEWLAKGEGPLLVGLSQISRMADDVLYTSTLDFPRHCA